jgi:hypothetical protein
MSPQGEVLICRPIIDASVIFETKKVMFLQPIVYSAYLAGSG